MEGRMITSKLRFFGLLLGGVFVALLLTLAPSGSTAQAQACDTSGTRDGTAVPSVVPPGTSVSFTATNFSAGEEVSYWFTLPDGTVFGTARPLCCADDSGAVHFEPLVMPQEFYQFPGRWALTVKGASSSHTSVIYFCLVTAVQPTEPPATNTPVPVPPTDTPAPPTATTAPPTVAATATSAATVEASPTVAATIEVSPTVAATIEVSPTVAATAEASPTTVPTVEVAPPTVEVLPTTPPAVFPTFVATPITPGMPTTGGSASGAGDGVLYAIVVLAALSMIALGLSARRKSPVRR
jgi:hypothetical protein